MVAVSSDDETEPKKTTLRRAPSANDRAMLEMMRKTEISVFLQICLFKITVSRPASS